MFLLLIAIKAVVHSIRCECNQRFKVKLKWSDGLWVCNWMEMWNVDIHFHVLECDKVQMKLQLSGGVQYVSSLWCFMRDDWCGVSGVNCTIIDVFRQRCVLNDMNFISETGKIVRIDYNISLIHVLYPGRITVNTYAT